MTVGQKDISKLSFEEGLKELEVIVRHLESGGQDLDASIEEYTRGIKLKKHCEKQLTDAKLKVEKITTNADGSLGVENFDAEKQT